MLGLQNNNISDEAANALAAAIKSNNSLEKLWLSGNHLGSSIIIVIDALKEISTLKELAVNDNKNRSEKLFLPLVSVITQNKLIEKLRLSDNNLNDHAAIQIARSLYKSSKLKCVNLQNNNITEKAAKALASVISHNPRLQELCLGNNQLNLGVMKIATALQNISSLKFLGLQNNNISDEAANTLAAAIKSNNSLEKLWLSGNHLGSSMVVVVNALKGITTLKDLALNDNKSKSKELAPILASVITQNKFIKRLLLS